MCNGKRFAIAILFFLLLIPSAIFGQTTKGFLANVKRLVSREVCYQDLTHALDTTENISVKIVPEIVIRGA